MMVVHQHARHSHGHGGTAHGARYSSSYSNAAAAAATTRVIRRRGVRIVTPARTPAQRSTASAVVTQTAHVSWVTHDQHAAHDGSTASLTRIRAGVVTLAHGTRRSWATEGRVWRGHRGRRLHIVMGIRMRMRDIIVARIDVTRRHHANAARTARAHAHSHAALQTAQRSVGTAMMTVTVVATMVTPVGTATPAVHGHAAGQRVVRRLDRTDHRTAAHDVRQLVGLNVKVLGLDYVR